jgi:nitrite reductase (NO-forming)
MLAAFFIPALAFLVAGGLAAVLNLTADPPWARWLSLHLLLLGGVSQLVLGSAQFFAAAFLATDPPRRVLIAGQLAAWNTGVLLIAIGRPAGMTALVTIGSSAILAGLVLFVAGLLDMKRRSLQSNPWAVIWYGSAAVSLACGALAGVLLAEGRTGDYAGLLSAHLILNLAGWLGGAIVGTLHTFYASLTGTRLAFPALERSTFFAWFAGVALIAAGTALDSNPAAALGWSSLALAAGLLSANLLMSFRRRVAPPGLPVRLVTVAQPFLPVALAVALISTLSDGTLAPFTGESESLVAVLALAGWIGLTVAGSLLHLLAMLARVRSGFAFQMPSPRPVADTLVTAAAALGVAAMAAGVLASSSGLTLAGRLLLLAAAVPVVALLLQSALKVIKPAKRAGGPALPSRPA